MVRADTAKASAEAVTYEVRIEGNDGTVVEGDACRVRRYEMVCALHEPYVLEAELWFRGQGETVSLDALAGADFCLAMHERVGAAAGDFLREWHGVVLSASYLGTFDGYDHVRVRVGPALALLGIGRRSRIFQGLSVLEVVRAIVGELDASKPRELEVRGVEEQTLEPVDYLVQYQECDLSFIQRILADAGLTFLFAHDGEHERVVILGDNQGFVGAHVHAAGGSEPAVAYVQTREQRGGPRSSIAWVERVRSVRPRTVSVEGWDWAASEPGPVAGKAEAEPEDPWAFGERFEHEPGRLVERDGHRVEHDDLSQAQADRLDAVEAARADRIRGGGDLLGLEAGTTLTLHGHPHPELGESYLVTRAVHRGDCPQVDIGESSPFAGADYENTFEAQVLDLPYRPRRRDKPRVLGPQTAVVVGPPGEEIHTDALGRVQVRMRWDRQQRDRSDETSCWLRVAQLWAGAGWGALFLPRVGMEVLVAFVDGDPDRPMVAGTLYNGAHEPPYPLPEQRTRSTIRTQSSPGGEGFNELRFDDAAGAEEVYLHAQRDHNEEAERNHTQRVGASQSIRVGRDQAQRIGGSRRVEVGSEEHVVVGKAPSDPDSPPPPPLEPATQTTEVHGSIATKAHETIVVDATQSLTLRVGGTSITVTPGGIALAVDGGATLDLTQALQVASAQQQGTLQLDERGVATLASKQGGSLRLDEDLNVETKGGTTLTMNAGAKLHTGGGAKLEMSKTIDLLARAIAAAIDGDETKLELAARLARLASSETAEVIGGSSSVATSSTGVEGSGPKIDLQAAGLLNLQGAITKINE